MASTSTPDSPPATRPHTRRLEQLIDDLQVALDKMARDQQGHSPVLHRFKPILIWCVARSQGRKYSGPERRRRRLKLAR